MAKRGSVISYNGKQFVVESVGLYGVFTLALGRSKAIKHGCYTIVK